MDKIHEFPLLLQDEPAYDLYLHRKTWVRFKVGSVERLIRAKVQERAGTERTTGKEDNES